MDYRSIKKLLGREEAAINSAIEDSVSAAPANDVATEQVSTHTRLRLVHGAAANDTHSGEARKLETAPEVKRFKVVGIDRLHLPDGMWTVVRGEVDGEPKALVFDAAHPPELTLFPYEKVTESNGLLGALGRSVFGRVMFALGSAMAAAACTSPDFGNANGDGGISKGKLGTHQAALTEDDADNLGEPILIPWSDWGDEHPNIAQIGGEIVFTFSRADGEIWYVNCDDLEICLTAGVPTLIDGLPAVPAGQVRKGAIYQDVVGDNIAYTTGGSVVYRAIAYGAGGTLEAPVFGGVVPAMSTNSMSHSEINGESHILWQNIDTVIDRNMVTGAEDLTGMTGADYCFTPHQDDDGVAIGSAYMPGVGPLGYRCHLVQAPDLASLQASLNFINSQNVTGPPAVIHDRLVNPRVFGNILIYARYDENLPGSGNWEPRMYYAVVQEYCGNTVCAPADGEDAASCPDDCPPDAEVCDDAVDNDLDGATDCADPDCVGDPACALPDDDDSGIPGDDDAGDDDVVIPEICDDGIENDGDGATDCDDPDCAADPACALPDDDDSGGDDDAGDDDSGDDDAGPDDDDSSTTPDACDFVDDRITITKGECNLDNCEDPFVDVVGACTFEVDLGNKNPVTLEIDGRYGLDFLNDAGELLAGSYRVIDDGNEMETVTGDLVTGVVGTIYGGDVNQAGDTYHVYCEEGVITISYNDKIIATLEAGQKQTFNLDDPVPGDDDDTQDDDDTTQDAGDDDVSDGDDTDTPPPGCSCDIKGGPENANHAKRAGMLLLMAVAFMRRRIGKKA